jgi:hypothetical protein
MISILAYTALAILASILTLAVVIGYARITRIKNCPCRTLAHNQCRKND